MGKKGYFRSQLCDFLLEKSNLSEITICSVNQGYLSYKDNIKIYYCDTYILGQVVPMLNLPENLQNYELQSNEARIIRPKHDPIS